MEEYVWTGPLPMPGSPQNTLRGPRNRAIIALADCFARSLVLKIIRGARAPDLALSLPLSEGEVEVWVVRYDKAMQKSLVITGVVVGFLVLDAFNEAICIADLAPGEVSILARLKRAIPDAVAGFEGVAWIDGEAITMPLQTVKAGAEGQLVINFQLPIGYKLNPAAPIDYAVHVRGHSLQVSNSERSLSAHAIELPLTIPFQTSAGTHRVDLAIEATFYWCREDNTGVCLIQSAHWHVPVETSETDENRILSVSTTAELIDQAGSALSPTAPLE
jgi:hypothetical protein